MSYISIGLNPIILRFEEKMDFLGTVEEITGDDRLIVQCKKLPDIGDAVFDARQTRIGTVGKVFGPVDEPFASITQGKNAHTKKGTELFFRGRTQNGKGKRGNRRD